MTRVCWSKFGRNPIVGFCSIYVTICLSLVPRQSFFAGTHRGSARPSWWTDPPRPPPPGNCRHTAPRTARSGRWRCQRRRRRRQRRCSRRGVRHIWSQRGCRSADTPDRQLRDNVPVFSYLINSDLLSRTSLPKRSNRRWFRLHLSQTIKRKMAHWTPKNALIVLKLRSIPPSTHGVSFTIWQHCHSLTTRDATVWLPPGARINRQAQRWGMMGRNWVCFRTFDFRI